ncbi:GntR family transcriptional regulator [Bacillus sp. 03113]|uniref:GntR family transcriptional regulator n=1 Tax=Bacillus sp. 03113 TaxID=2578211 RepID=UPI001142E4A9|nr:GntR family transcriptional regulator [Bacillus sp. 03113]
MENMNIKPIKRSSFRDEVYVSLKKAIIMLEMKPGQRLNDKELAEKFQISRTPVREAIKRLEDEGLVESVPGSVTRVTEINLEEARHAFTVVAALQSLAARLAIPRLIESDFEKLEFFNAQLKNSMTNLKISDAIEADAGFHNVFLQTAGNPEIVSALDRILPKIYRLEIYQFGSTQGFKSVEQHNGIIEACRKGEKDLIGKLVEENWLSLGEILTRQ